MEWIEAVEVELPGERRLAEGGSQAVILVKQRGVVGDEPPVHIIAQRDVSIAELGEAGPAVIGVAVEARYRHGTWRIIREIDGRGNLALDVFEIVERARDLQGKVVVDLPGGAELRRVEPLVLAGITRAADGRIGAKIKIGIKHRKTRRR